MLILHHARIQTMSPNLPSATALAIEGERILAVGNDDEILSLASRRTEQRDMQGKTIWPGLTDAHIHLQNYALSLSLVDCETDSRAECIRRVAERGKSAAPGQWIRGHGWNQNSWPEGFGSAALLDEVSGDHPVFLTAKSLHAAWANSVALRLAGIDARTPDPDGGKLLRDASGQPTGILLESAMELVQAHIPKPSGTQITQMIRAAQKELWRLGITGVHDYDPVTCFTALQILEKNEELRLRVVKGIPHDVLPHAIEAGLRSGFGSDYLRIGSVKCFADGALGPQTAAMLQPYEGSPQNTGILLLDSEQVFETGQKAALGGISVAIHAIGDRANHEVLNGYAQLRDFETSQKLPHLRHRIEHVQILHPDDSLRLARLGVIASVQPIHATSDMLMADRFWGRRSSGAYAFRTLLDAHTSLAFGSDAPVESPNPFLGLHAAVTRQRPAGQPGRDGWYPEQRLDLREALAGYTTGPAYAAGLENRQGQLAPGFFADLIVLEDDPFGIPASDLYAVHPLATMVGGHWVWESS